MASGPGFVQGQSFLGLQEKLALALAQEEKLAVALAQQETHQSIHRPLSRVCRHGRTDTTQLGNSLWNLWTVLVMAQTRSERYKKS